MAINFFFLPPSMRVVFVGMCTFVWDNFLCWLKRKEIEPSDEAPTITNQLKTEQIIILSEEQPFNPGGRSMLSIEQPLKSEGRTTPPKEHQLLWNEEAVQSDLQCTGYLSQRRTNPQSLPDVR